MDYTTLGRTGLKVSVAGLGCGGFSRLGQGTGKTEAESVAIVKQALDAGVTFIDTAEAYGTQGIVGKALKSVPRDQYVLSTKAQPSTGQDPRPAAEVVAALDSALVALGVDCIDVFHLHGVLPKAVRHAFDEVMPALLKEKEKGKFKHLGITEMSSVDHTLEVLTQAVEVDAFDVVMVAYHMMHQVPRTRLFPTTKAKGIGTLDMFAVRTLFSRPELLKQAMQQLADEGKVPAGLAQREEPLDFLLSEGGARSITDAAYRYCRHDPGIDVVLFGTGNPQHLADNIASLTAPPLEAAAVAKLHTLFGELEGIGLVRAGKK